MAVFGLWLCHLVVTTSLFGQRGPWDFILLIYNFLSVSVTPGWPGTQNVDQVHPDLPGTRRSGPGVLKFCLVKFLHPDFKVS